MTYSKPFLSLCMIVKNEEDNISRSLSSIQGLVDEIVVVDTGSQDKTVEIARNYGAKTYFFPWQNDFSAARNYALNQARGEWVLFLDADEEIRSTKFYLKEFLQSSLEEGYFVKIKNLEDNQNILNSFSFRLFRNNPLYRYEGKIHEQILPVIQRVNPNTVIDWLDLEIYHYGYQESQIKAKDKVKRNLEILLNEDPEIKETSFYCFNLGMEYLRIKKFFEAEKWFKNGWEKVDTHISFAHRLILKLIICLFLQEKYAEAVVYCQQAEEFYPDYADLYYYHGASLMELGQLGEGRKVLLRGLEKGKSPSHYISEAGCGSYLNLEALGLLEEAHMNFNLAADYFWQALKLQPNDSYYLKLLLRNLVKSDFNLCNFFVNKLTFLNRELLEIGGNFLFNLGKYNLAQDLVKLRKEKHPAPSQTLLQAKIHLMLGNLSQALELLEQVPLNTNSKKEAVFYTWIAAWLKNDFKLAEKACREMNLLEKEAGNLLNQLQQYLTFYSWEEVRLQGLTSERNTNLLLIIIESFAAILGFNEMVAKTVAFTEKVGGEEILIIVAKILFKQKLYVPALEILNRLDWETFDLETALALVELNREKKPVIAGAILNKLREQNPSLARIYLMGMDLWLKEGGKTNIQILKKVLKLKEVPALC